MAELEKATAALRNFILALAPDPETQASLLLALDRLTDEAEQAQALRLDLETAQAQNIALVSALNATSRRLGEMVGLGE